MASNPPQFQVEDQTDEDFFDNLVNDEDDFVGPTKTPIATNTTISSTSTSAVNDKFTVDSNDSDSDDAKAFANLTIDDGGIDSRQKVATESIGEKKSEPDDSIEDIGTESIAENKSNWNGWEQNFGTELNLDDKSDLVAGRLDESNNEGDAKDGIDPVPHKNNGSIEDIGTESIAENKSNWNGWEQNFGTELNLDDKSDLVAGRLDESNNEGDAKDGMDPVPHKNNGSMVREVGWNSFYADRTEQNGNHGFGSYSDFFSDLGENTAEFPGKVEGNANVALSANGEAKILSRNEESKTGLLLGNSIDYGNYAQYQDSQVYGAEQNANGHDLNSIEYWESMYPGWKYDANTGQWYQVGATVNTQQGSSDTASGSDWNVISEKSELAYLKQNSQSVVGTVSETSTTESVSNWKSQVSQVNNNGYPEHMIFDPQYPGWYYDTIAQEWRALESYNSSEQSIVQSHDQQSQNGFTSADAYFNNSNSIYGEFGQAIDYGSQGDGIQSLHDKQADNYGSQGLGNLNQNGSWAESYGNYNRQGLNMWQPKVDANAMSVSNFRRNQQVDNFYGSKASLNSHVDQQNAFSSMQSIPSYDKASQGHGVEAKGISGFQNFVPSGDFSQQFNQAYMKQNEQMQHSNDLYGSQNKVTVPQQSLQSDYQNSYAPNIGRSSAGRPPHALVTFGFGGKLVVMKDNSSLQNSAFGNQGHVEASISVLNLMEVVLGNTDASSTGTGAFGYFRALCQQSFAGPLVGGSVGSKELNKWIDERIANCESPDMDYRKGEALKLLLSLLKIACQHYGKLRSPFGTDATLRESDTPESAVAKLFASAKMNGTQFGSLNHCLQNLPSEGQIRATASEVQNLLVSGRKKEALLCAQEGQLWGPALILASQLGEQFYVDTVKQMALRQLIAGSPLRTLCLLIAGQPADVFATEVPAVNGFPGAVTMSQQSTNFGDNCMLNDWEENLAVITANRTKDDELVIIHLGDCLWKDRSEITAAHICYLVAEANFEPYSDSARLCLIGADHWKFPRTYASPDAIQRTELYEYSKVLGNSQFSLLPFQPYKLIYAHMLAEVGKVSDSLKYCQALSKSLKTGRAPEIEIWKQLVSSLEERIRIHQQGGFTANLAPGKLVGKLLNFFDSTAHRVVGGLPPPAPSASQGTGQSNEHDYQPMGNRVSGSQSTMAMSSLIPSASMEPISEWAADGNRMTVPNRSVSEPDFGRTPRQHQVDSSMEASSSSAEGKASGSGGTSRFSRFGFGSGLLQKTVGLVLRPRADKQAKLGEKNKFYYDEKLKRWVEEGAEPPAEEAALAPPPTTAAFQNGTSDYNLQYALKSEGSSSNGSPIIRSPPPSEQTSGIPPIPTSTNQFSARGRMGVRSRYVDTFNQGKASPAKSFQSPPIPSVKPAATANAKFFVPAPPSPAEQPMEAIAENVPEESATGEKPSTSIVNDSFQPPASSMTKQRSPSMDNIPGGSMTRGNSPLPPHTRRTASWSGSFPDGLNPNLRETKPLGEAMGMPPSSFLPSPISGGSVGDELHEVEL